MKFCIQARNAPNMQEKNFQADICILSAHVNILETCTDQYIRPTHCLLKVKPNYLKIGAIYNQMNVINEFYRPKYPRLKKKMKALACMVPKLFIFKEIDSGASGGQKRN